MRRKQTTQNTTLEKNFEKLSKNSEMKAGTSIIPRASKRKQLIKLMGAIVGRATKNSRAPTPLVIFGHDLTTL